MTPYFPAGMREALLRQTQPVTFFASIIGEAGTELTRRIKCMVTARAEPDGSVKVDAEPKLEYSVGGYPGKMRLAFFTHVFGGAWIFTIEVEDYMRQPPRADVIRDAIEDELRRIGDLDTGPYIRGRGEDNIHGHDKHLWLIDGDVDVAEMAKRIDARLS